MEENGISTHQHINFYVVAFKEHKHQDSPGGYHIGFEDHKGQTAILGAPFIVKNSPDVNKLYLMGAASGFEHIANKMRHHRVPLLEVGVHSYQVYLTKVMKHIIETANQTILFDSIFGDPSSYKSQIEQRLSKNIEQLTVVLDKIDFLSTQVPELKIRHSLVKKEERQELYSQLYKQLKRGVYNEVGITDYRLKKRPQENNVVVPFKTTTGKT